MSFTNRGGETHTYDSAAAALRLYLQAEDDHVDYSIRQNLLLNYNNMTDTGDRQNTASIRSAVANLVNNVQDEEMKSGVISGGRKRQKPKSSKSRTRSRSRSRSKSRTRPRRRKSKK